MKFKPSGDQQALTSEQREDLENVRQRFVFKDQIKNFRVLQLREQADFMSFMMPYAAQFNSFDARSRSSNTPNQIYKSGIMHTAWNILSYGSTKLYPDFVDFTPEKTQRMLTSATEAQNLAYIVNLARKKGKYIAAVKKTQRDLVRGESYLYQDWGVDEDSKPTAINFVGLDFNNVWHQYGETDVIVVNDMSVLDFICAFGQKMLDKVTFGKVLGSALTDNDDNNLTDRRGAKPFETQLERIQVVYYIDPASRMFQIWMGGNKFLFRDLQGDDYPFVRNDGSTYQPVKRRTFYPPTPGDSYFGYGPLDLLIPLARLQNNIVNSTAIRAIKAASRPVIMATNDPIDASMKYDQYLDEISFAQNNKPFFVQDSATGTTMKPQIIDEGVDNANMQVWNEFFLDEATIRTRLNFRSLSDLAPTGIQDELRIQLEETANKIVLKSNADVDADFAEETVFMLKNGDSKFHDLKVWLVQDESELISSAEDAEIIESLRGPGGELQPVETTIRKFMSTIKDPQYDVTPRVDGIFDNKTAIEIRAMERSMQLFGGFPGVIAKIGKQHLDEIIPEAGITEQDFLGQPQGGGGAPDIPKGDLETLPDAIGKEVDPVL